MIGVDLKVSIAGLAAGLALGLFALVGAPNVGAESIPPPGIKDSRVRAVAYDPDQVYRLRGFIGYQIDIEFAPDERFVGLGAGDVDALAFAGERNHLFLKPKARSVSTNITVLTTRRTYQFRYTAASLGAATDPNTVVYALRFRYAPPAPRAAAAARLLDRRMNGESAGDPPNYDYWYCGSPSLKPVAAWDDGVQTRLRFAANAEMPAIFVRNDDGSESLLNFSIDGGEVVLHRVARRFVLRRGRLSGCVVNQAFHGGGRRLRSGTVSPQVERVTRGSADER